MNASIERQFEFLQQQWINYGNDLGLGDDKDAVAGAHDTEDKLLIQGDPDRGGAPYICTPMPRFVRMRGGEYFFMPGLAALDLIAAGRVHSTF